MAELKTRPNKASVSSFINQIEDEQKRKDCKQLSKLMRAITGKQAKMWGTSIIGFGSYHYIYKTGNEGDWMITGFSPRKQNISIYIMSGFKGHAALLKKLGNHKTAKSCLYIKKLDDIDINILEMIIAKSVADIRGKYPCR